MVTGFEGSDLLACALRSVRGFPHSGFLLVVGGFESCSGYAVFGVRFAGVVFDALVLLALRALLCVALRCLAFSLCVFRLG